MKRKHVFSDGRKLTCCAKLQKIGKQTPYFSLTGKIVDKKGKFEAGGCLHDEIVQVWPDLQILADIHLSDENGIPPHAVENGFYFAGGFPKEFSDARSPKKLAKLFRITEKEANEICVEISENPNQERFRSICCLKLDDWALQAKNAIEKFDLKIE